MTRKLSLAKQDLQDIQQRLSLFGARLRTLRLQHGLTLNELAAQSGLSKAFLSRLESGSRQASISAALTLSKILQVSLASLFESPLTDARCTIIRAADLVEKSVNGLKYSPLSKVDRLFNVLPLRIKVPASRGGDEHYQHDGEEWIYVLRGKLTLSLAGKTFDLEQGDAAHFESRLPHRLIARGGRGAEILVVAAPNWVRSGSPIHRSFHAGAFEKIL